MACSCMRHACSGLVRVFPRAFILGIKQAAQCSNSSGCALGILYLHLDPAYVTAGPTFYGLDHTSQEYTLQVDKIPVFLRTQMAVE